MSDFNLPGGFRNHFEPDHQIDGKAWAIGEMQIVDYTGIQLHPAAFEPESNTLYILSVEKFEHEKQEISDVRLHSLKLDSEQGWQETEMHALPESARFSLQNIYSRMLEPNNVSLSDDVRQHILTGFDPARDREHGQTATIAMRDFDPNSLLPDYDPKVHSDDAPLGQQDEQKISDFAKHATTRDFDADVVKLKANHLSTEAAELARHELEGAYTGSPPLSATLREESQAERLTAKRLKTPHPDVVAYPEGTEPFADAELQMAQQKAAKSEDSAIKKAKTWLERAESRNNNPERDR